MNIALALRRISSHSPIIQKCFSTTIVCSSMPNTNFVKRNIKPASYLHSSIMEVADISSFNPDLINLKILKETSSITSVNDVTPYHSPKKIILPSVKSIYTNLPVLTPLQIIPVDLPPLTKTISESPSVPIVEKHAARLIVIRRRKMKKHKLRKLRKKMKFVWAKVKQRRNLKKEKAFQAELLAQIKEGEQFDAAKYVAEKLAKSKLDMKAVPSRQFEN